MNPSITSSPRPLISFKDGKILHNGNNTHLSMTREVIRVGCSDITPEAATFIIEEWKKRFGTNHGVVIQP